MESLTIHIRTDQPITCPKCGARTDIFLDLSHTKFQTTIEECLNPKCKFVFVSETDEDEYYLSPK